MKVLQLGDTHLGIGLRTLGGPPGWTRADDHLSALRAALGPAMRQEVDLVVHTGDVFDRSRPHRAAVEAAMGLLARVAHRVPVVVLAGNHDRFGVRCHFGPGARGLTVVDEASQLEVAGLRIGLVPHFRMAADWAEAARVATRGGVDLLVCHQGFVGAWVPGFTFREGNPTETVGERHLPPDRIGAVMSGHLHPHQWLRWGPHTVVYAGSTERTTVGEAHQTKGTVVWEVEDRWSWRFRPGAARPWMRVDEAADLDRIQGGDLISMEPSLLRRLGPAAVDRGGRVVLPRSGPTLSRRQVRLF